MEIDFNNFKLAQCIHGIMIWPTNDSVIGKCLPLYGEWSEGENIIMSEYISEGDTVIDIGANIGTTALSMSKNVGKTGKVIAFEPQQLMSQCLNTNLTLNDITNVDVYNIAISNESGWAKLNDHEFSNIGRYGEAGISDKGTTIKTITLDEIELDKCSLVKIDIEGHEWQAIQGAKSFLLKHKPALYMEAKKEVADTKKYMKWLFDNGWTCYWHFAWWYRENNINNNKNNIFPGIGDMNILAIHNDDNQPKNLLKLKDYDENWNQGALLAFYKENNLELI